MRHILVLRPAIQTRMPKVGVVLFQDPGSFQPPWEAEVVHVFLKYSNSEMEDARNPNATPPLF